MLRQGYQRDVERAEGDLYGFFELARSEIAVKVATQKKAEMITLAEGTAEAKALEGVGEGKRLRTIGDGEASKIAAIGGETEPISRTASTLREQLLTPSL